jgi:glycosyltransferase involved in cell wall biosynthesis
MKYIFYYPHSPLPPTSGADQRAIQLLSGLIQRGEDVHFVSSQIHTGDPWDQKTIDRLVQYGCRTVDIHEPSLSDRAEIVLKTVWLHKTGRWDPFVNAFVVPRGLVQWFHQIVSKRNPERILVTYCWYSKLVRGLDAAPTMIDHHGLFSINNRMEAWLKRELLDFRNGQEHSPDLFSPELYSKITPAVADAEIDHYRQFDQIITLSEKEDAILRTALNQKRITFLPLTYEPPVGFVSSKSKSPVAVVGPNPFNEHGLEQFGSCVMPLIRTRAQDFRLNVVGKVATKCREYPGLNYLGYVESLKSVFSSAMFSVCCTALGTGQQVKIVEALAHGLPVIAFKSAAEGTLVSDGENGFVVSSFQEFCDRVLELRDSPKLCRDYGDHAIDVVRQNVQQYASLPGI